MVAREAAVVNCGLVVAPDAQETVRTAERLDQEREVR